MSPKRVQLRRTRGWRMPPNTVSVSRPTKWGNPYRVLPYEAGGLPMVVGPYGDEHPCAPGEAHGVAVRLFRADLYDGRLAFDIHDVRRELRGKDLGCWCGEGQPCHVDVLIEAANGRFPR